MRPRPLIKEEVLERLRNGDRLIATKGIKTSYSMASDGAYVQGSMFWVLIDQLEAVSDGLFPDHPQTYRLRSL